jgi:hypothetical protein
LQHLLAAPFAADLVTGFQQPVLAALFKPMSRHVAPNRLPERQRNQPYLVSVDECGAEQAFSRGACIPDQKKKCAAFAVK